MTKMDCHSIKLSKLANCDEWCQTEGGHIGRVIKVPSNVSIVWGHPTHEEKPNWIPQILRFPVSSYTLTEVTKWAKDNLKSWIKIEAGKKGTEASIVLAREMLTFGGELKAMLATEAFLSLRTELEKAISYKFGRDAWVSDFSNKEVIIGYSKSDVHPISSWESGDYEKISYKVAKGAVTLVGTISKVSKTVSYTEGMDVKDWDELWKVEFDFGMPDEKAIRAQQICRVCKS